MEFAHYRIHLLWKAEKQQLLDRIMSRTFPEYVKGEVEMAKGMGPTLVVPVDELMAKLNDMQETGISPL